jgi:hypothetical protein
LPFNLIIARAPTFASIDRPSWFQRVRPITDGEFQTVMAGGSPERRPGGDLWVRHPTDGLPWFVTRLTARGAVVLSCSYTNHRFLRNFPDAFDMGRRLARAFGGYLFEEVRGTKINPLNINKLLNPAGDYVTGQSRVFQRTVARINARAGGPLEYPLGEFDIVPEYFVFHCPLPDEAPADLPSILSGVTLPFAPAEVAPDHAVVPDQAGTPAARILLRPDRTLQVWPSHGAMPWSASATSTLATFEALHAAFPGPVTLCHRALDGELLAAVRTMVGGLGVCCYEWVRTWQEPSAVE